MQNFFSFNWVRTAQTGQTFTVAALQPGAIAVKLLAMGILPGSRLTLVRKAPLGGAWYVLVDDYSVALRDEELEVIATA